jgi:hypothetical protein
MGQKRTAYDVSLGVGGVKEGGYPMVGNVMISKDMDSEDVNWMQLVKIEPSGALL